MFSKMSFKKKQHKNNIIDVEKLVSEVKSFSLQNFEVFYNKVTTCLQEQANSDDNQHTSIFSKKSKLNKLIEKQLHECAQIHEGLINSVYDTRLNSQGSFNSDIEIPIKSSINQGVEDLCRISINFHVQVGYEQMGKVLNACQDMQSKQTDLSFFKEELTQLQNEIPETLTGIKKPTMRLE